MVGRVVRTAGLFIGLVSLVPGFVPPPDLVAGTGSITASPDSFNETLPYGGSLSRLLTLTNTTADDLRFAIRLVPVTAATGTRSSIPVMNEAVTFLSQGEVILSPGNANLRGQAIVAPVAHYRVGTSPSSILVYADDYHQAPGTHYVDRALQQLGHSYTAYYDDPGGFGTALVTGSWDLVIVAHDSNYGVGLLWTELEDYVRGGGRAVISTFDIDGSHSEATTLWSTLDLIPAGDIDLALPVYRWDLTHPILITPHQIPDLTQPSQDYLDNGDLIDAGTGASLIAGRTAASAPGSGAILGARTLPVIVNSFIVDNHRLDLDLDGTPDAVELYMNEIEFAGGAPNWLSVTPTTGTLPAGSSLEVVVDFGPVRLAPGDYRAEIQVDSETLPSPVTVVPVVLRVTGAADVEVSPAELDYGPLFIGATRTLTLRVRNLGTDLLSVDGVQGDDADFSVDPAGFSLAVGASRDLAVTFRPTRVADIAATLSLGTNDPDEPRVTVPLRGTGLVAPDIAVDPPALETGLFAGERTVLTLTLRNFGGSALVWGAAVHLLAPGLNLQPPWLAVSPGAGTLAAGDTQVLQAAFDAAQLIGGEYRAEVRVDSNDPDEPTVAVPVVLRVTGAADVEVSPAELDYGPLFIGATRTLTLRVRNLGTDLLSVDGVQVDDADFSVDPAGFSLAVGASRDLAVTFRPTRAADIAATLSLGTNDPDEPRVTVPLRGTGLVAPDIAVDPPALETGLFAGERTVLTLTLRNFGGSALAWTAAVRLLAPGLNPQPPWAAVGPGAGTLAAGDTQVLQVAFDAAQLIGGEYRAEVRVDSNDPDEPTVAVPVVLRVTGAADVEVSPAELDYGPLLIGATRTLTLRVRNLGTDLLSVDGVQVDDADFSVDPAGFSLAVGASRDLAVTFRPTRVADIAATLSLGTNDPDEPRVTVPLRGSGVTPPVATVEPQSLSVIVPLGQQSTRALTISNQGGSPLEFSIKVRGGPNPGGWPNFCADGLVVAESSTGRITWVDAFTGSPTRLVQFSGGAVGIVLDPSGTEAYTLEPATGTLWKVQISTRRTTRIATGFSFFSNGLAIDGTGRTVYVGETTDPARLQAVDVATGSVRTVAGGLASIRGIAINRSATTAYVTESETLSLSAVDLATGSRRVVTSSNLNYPAGVVLDPTERLAYVSEAYSGEISRVDLSTGAVLAVAFGLDSPLAITLDPHQPFAWVTESSSGTIARVALDGGGWVRKAVGLAGPHGLGYAVPRGCSGSFLTVDPLHGLVPAGLSTTITVLLSSAGLGPGSYEAMIEIPTNDPITPLLSLPVSFTVVTDRDHDGHLDHVDNCPDVPNPDQSDRESDRIGDVCDVCPDVADPGQQDRDADRAGDACDLCPAAPDPGQQDRDGDRIGDACDNCPATSNADQADDNNDGAGDACQPMLALLEVVEDGGENLEVRAFVRDPQDDPIQGTMDLVRVGRVDTFLEDISVTLGCDLALNLGVTPGEGVAFAYGSLDTPVLLDVDGTLGCNDFYGDYEIATGTCAAPTSTFQSILPLQEPGPICIRPLSAPATLLQGMVFSIERERAHVSIDLEASLAIRIPVGPSLPRRSDISTLEAGATYDLAITVTDGSTVPIRAVATFQHRGETTLIINNPPRAVITTATTVECGETAHLDGSSSQDDDSTPGTADDIVTYEWMEQLAGGAGRLLGTGPLLDVSLAPGPHDLRLRVTDSYGETGEAPVVVTSRDTIGPALSVSASPAVLWPPNHEPRPVSVSWLADDRCDPSPAVTLISVESSEPDDAEGPGDGNTQGDIQGVDPGTPDTLVHLRAERSGTGVGRTYTLHYAVVDSSGNTGRALTVVTIPHDLGGDTEPMDLRLDSNDTPGMVRVRWEPLADAIAYDLIQGDLSALRIDGDHIALGDVRILARGLQRTDYDESDHGAIPPPGRALFYLVQSRDAQGGTGFGTESAPLPRRPTGCEAGCP